ncbi:MAG TPA: tryptophan synthase subunit alpha, partial [Flavobacteriales bacterium]|nr:tryptophan synthase subunit alpha [Flavobacteriales bacterium]
MKTIKAAFTKKEKLISVFFTAGYPGLGLIKETCAMLEKAGTDMVEIGMPCSDPLADGPVIQQSSMKALQNGFTLNKMFEELTTLRNAVNMPVLLMGYYNQVLQYGVAAFAQKAKDCGINGFIVPDQPLRSAFADLCSEMELVN